MGVVVVGGMFLATFLTLYIIPSLYVVLSRVKREKQHHGKAPAAAAVVAVLALLFSAQPVASQVLTLDEALSLAITRNYDVRLARQDSAAARITGSRAITGFLPTANVTATYADGANNLTQVLASGQTIERNGAGYSNLNAVGILNWTIFDGLRMFAAADRLSAAERRGLAIVQSKLQFIIADVITKYSALVATTQFLKQADSAKVLATQRYEIERNRVEAGSVSGVELRQAEIDKYDAELVVLRNRMELGNRMSELNTLLGRDPATQFTVSDTMVMPELPPQPQAQSSIDRTNPDVLAAQHALAEASAHVAEVTATFLPRIAVQGAYQVTRNTSDAGFLLQNRSNGAYVGATLQWNLFNGLNDAYDRQLAKLDEERSRISIDAIRNDLRGQIDRAYRTHAALQEQRRIQQASLAAAERNASVALEKLRIGSVTPLEVRQSLLSYLDAAEGVARLAYQDRLVHVEILRLQGALVQTSSP
jgi:outer membrane protein TolC